MTDYDQLIHLNVELEGLLKVLRDRDSIEARSLLSRKFSDYTRMVNELLQEPAPTHTPQPEAQKPIADEVHDAKEVEADANYVEVKDQEAVSDEVEPEMDAATEAIERGQREAMHTREEPAHPAPQTLGETIHATSLATAFTLNDKFRFVRDVFNGNDADFTETVNVLQEMTSYKEAYQYLVEDLQLDPEEPAVADFIDVVARYF